MKPDNYKIYENPTVKKVIFQIRFSNLFMIESRIGEFQTLIMEKFPESSFSIRRQLLFADVGPQFKMEEIPLRENLGKKIWQFKSNNRYILNVLTNSIDITSVQHKSYYENDKTNEEGFRDIIKFVMEQFSSLIKIKVIKRVGLRYIDECPIPALKDDNSNNLLTNDKFKEWYNTSLPLHRFDLKNLGMMKFEADLKHGDYNLIYRESLGLIENNFKFTLDFDGYKENVESENYLTVLDDIHKFIHNEWDNIIKDPVKEWMDKKEDN